MIPFKPSRHLLSICAAVLGSASPLLAEAAAGEDALLRYQKSPTRP
jgi:hypothetical protein